MASKRKFEQEQKELELLSMEFETVEEARLVLDEFVEYMRSLEGQHEDIIPFVAGMRKLKPETLESLKGFMLNPEDAHKIPYKYREYAYGIFSTQVHCLFSGRFMFPVFDVYEHVAGFVGWDVEGNPKYLDSLNLGYKAKASGFFGMQFLKQYYENKKVVVVEGPVCMMYLYENGVPVMSSLGSHLTPYMITMLKRFEDGCLVIPDGHGDEAGASYRKQVERMLPLARCVQPKKAKDIDDTRLWLRDQGEENADKIIAQEVMNLLNDPFYESEYFG